MPTNTSNLNLTVYDLSEINERFIDFRNNLAGNSNSNMTKIDTAVGSKQPKIYTGTSATAAATAARPRPASGEPACASRSRAGSTRQSGSPYGASDRDRNAAPARPAPARHDKSGSS